MLSTKYLAALWMLMESLYLVLFLSSQNPINVGNFNCFVVANFLRKFQTLRTNVLSGSYIWILQRQKANYYCIISNVKSTEHLIKIGLYKYHKSWQGVFINVSQECVTNIICHTSWYLCESWRVHIHIHTHIHTHIQVLVFMQENKRTKIHQQLLLVFLKEHEWVGFVKIMYYNIRVN